DARSLGHSASPLPAGRRREIPVNYKFAPPQPQREPGGRPGSLTAPRFPRKIRLRPVPALPALPIRAPPLAGRSVPLNPPARRLTHRPAALAALALVAVLALTVAAPGWQTQRADDGARPPGPQKVVAPAGGGLEVRVDEGAGVTAASNAV